MNRLNALLFMVGFLYVSTLYSQAFQEFSVPVSEQNRTLKNPWAGGLNAPQLSAVDLNNDGIDDLHVFDREGNVQLTFLTVEIAGKRQYVYAPAYVESFPNLENWVLLRDYNGDHIADIFGYSDVQGVDGMVIYTGSYEGNKLVFKRKQFNAPFGLVPFPLNGSVLTPIYISKVDYPAVDDVDCDGDLDILTFNLAGGYAELFQNQSVERGFKKDSLIFTLQNACWGGFYESGASESVDLAASPGACYRSGLDDLAVIYRHAGSTLLTLDMDGDGDKELILGDVSYNNLNLLTNGGSCKQPWMNKQDNRFPTADVPVDLPLFPAAYALDLDHDGLKDLAVTPSARFGSENRNAVWYYKNTGTATQPKYTLQRKDFLIQDMIDLGTGANPAFVDVNGDKLLDMVIGTQSLFNAAGARDSRLYLYLNVGNATQPAFALHDSDWLNFSALSATYFGFAPAFGDLDQDGDQDLLLGEESGRLLFMENKAGVGKPMQFGTPVEFWQGIDIGLASAPQIIDIDKDGLADLIIGERSGNVNYFKNTGSKGVPTFATTPTATNWGGIDTRLPGYVSGYSAPAVFRSADSLLVVTGSEDTGLQLYVARGSNAVFTKGSIPFPRVMTGFNSRPALADLNGDGLFEMAIGNNRGGLQLVKTPWLSGTATGVRTAVAAQPLQCYPNPTTSTVQLQLPDALTSAPLSAFVIDMQGQVLRSWTTLPSDNQISLEGLPAGWYAIRLIGEAGTFVGKVMKL